MTTRCPSSTGARHRIDRHGARANLRLCAGCDAHGRIQYLNSTLTDWLGYDLAEFNSGHLRLSDLVRGDGASLLMRGRGDGEIRTEIIDIDLVRRNGTMDIACFG